MIQKTQLPVFCGTLLPVAQASRVGPTAEVEQKLNQFARDFFLTFNYSFTVFLNVFPSGVHDNSEAIFLSACFLSCFILIFFKDMSDHEER